MVSGVRGDRLWLVWTAVGIAAIAGYFLVPRNSLASNVIYDSIGLVSSAVMAVGTRMRRPPRARLWYCFAIGQTVWVIGDITYSVYSYGLHENPFPSLADVFYLAAYPILAAGLVILVRGRLGRPDGAGMLDAGIVASAMSLLLWTFVMRPVLHEPATPLTTRLISMSYPAMDILLLALVAWLLTTSGARTASYRMLVAAVLLLLGADVAYTIITAVTEYNGGLLDAGWLLSYVMWASAALHPSARTLSSASPVPTTVSRVRLVALTGAMLLAPGTMLAQGVLEHGRVDWLGVGVGAGVMCVLALTRFMLLLAQVQRQSAALRTLAMRDDLTGLGNRRLLEHRLARAERPVRLALLDLDDFRGVNDRLGRDTGDELLIGVAARLAELARPQDTVVRLTGDEFGVLLPATEADEADAQVHTLMSGFARPLPAASHTLLVPATAGVAEDAGGVALDPAELLRRAGVALHSAKEHGRGGHARYVPAMDDAATERARLGAALRTALDEGQFELAYQPIVALPDGRMIGVEALVRWMHPTLGLIGPAAFVPAAERNGLIVELGAWVLREACAQAVRWDAELGTAAPHRISVNVSARQLSEPGLAAMVAETLAATGLPPHRLTVEVTETAVFDGACSIEELTTVHDMGVRVALDDFGTGHSSLGLLHTCPVDVLKVDKSFVDNITMSGRHSVIAAALIAVSTGLHLTAVAEGVETAAQADQLYRLGYRYAQGYHFGRPASADLIALTVGQDRHDVSAAA